jgi:ATP-dependent RNA helicase SUPV3L1/SUV3
VAAVARSGDVLVEGHYVGRLEAFHFVADETETPHAAKAVNAAAAKALRREIAHRIAAFSQEPDGAFSLAEDGRILWREAPVASLRRGPDALDPRVETLPADLLDGRQGEEVRARLARWFEAHRRARLGPLLDAASADLAGAARGIGFQLAQGLGSLPRRSAETQVQSLSQAERRALRRLGVRIERWSLYFPSLLEADAVALRALLWTVFHQPDVPPALPPPGSASVEVDRDTPASFYEAAGYRVCGLVAVRLDALERIAAEAWERSKKGAFAVDAPLLALAGCTQRQMTAILKAVGYAVEATKDGPPAAHRRPVPRRRLAAARSAPGAGQGQKKEVPKIDPSSPFAKLGGLRLKK